MPARNPPLKSARTFQKSPVVKQALQVCKPDHHPDHHRGGRQNISRTMTAYKTKPLVPSRIPNRNHSNHPVPNLLLTCTFGVVGLEVYRLSNMKILLSIEFFLPIICALSATVSGALHGHLAAGGTSDLRSPEPADGVNCDGSFWCSFIYHREIEELTDDMTFLGYYDNYGPGEHIGASFFIERQS